MLCCWVLGIIENCVCGYGVLLSLFSLNQLSRFEFGGALKFGRRDMEKGKRLLGMFC